MTLEEHYRTLAPRLTNWLIASGSPYAQACDLTQETFLKLWSMREQLYDNDAAVAGLAFTIARNLRKNQIRDNQRIVFTDQPLPEEAVENNAPAAEDMVYVRQRIQRPWNSYRPSSAKPIHSSKSPNSPSPKSLAKPTPPKTSSKSASTAPKPNSANSSPTYNIDWLLVVGYWLLVVGCWLRGGTVGARDKGCYWLLVLSLQRWKRPKRRSLNLRKAFQKQWNWGLKSTAFARQKHCN